jgi:hypothetical protein
MKRSDPTYIRIVAMWTALGRLAEVEARAQPDRDCPDGEFDELLAWTEGGLLLFTLVRVLVRMAGEALSDALKGDISAALTELGERAGLAKTEGATADASNIATALSADDELAFLAALNEYLMAHHQERLRFVEGDHIALSKLGIAATLVPGIDMEEPQAEGLSS